MLMRLRQEFSRYPGQFWLMFTGMILSTTGAAMIWPFLMIFASETLSLPLAAAASLMSINAAAGLVSSILAGPVVDRAGRKWVMAFGLIGNGLCYFILNWAGNYASFALAMGLSGAFSPLFTVGSDAMLADLFPAKRRADAYALIRMARNIGVAAGPALGGFVLSRSYSLGLYSAAVGLAAYGLMVLFFARETIPPEARNAPAGLKRQLRGYWAALLDRPFMGVVGAFTLVQMVTALVWVLLSVHVKTHFGISERLYGWLPTTNALMVVFLQVWMTRRTRHFPALHVLRWGSVFYIAAPLIVAFSSGFWGFWLAMAVMTLGELAVVPRASAYVANLAPADKRGRYLSLYGLSWNIAAGISPLLGGYLSDSFGLQAPWLGGALVGALALGAFWALQPLDSSAEQEAA
jgi:MFS family permease